MLQFAKPLIKFQGPNYVTFSETFN
jgi:hypothetical protein